MSSYFLVSRTVLGGEINRKQAKLYGDTRSATGQSESYTVAAATLGSGVDDGHGLDDEMTSQATTSDDVSILAASAVTLGLVLAVGSFAAMWVTDNPIPSLLFPAGLFLATYGFWLINRAARRRIARAH